MHTSAGSYVRIDDVKKIMAQRLISDEIEEEASPRPKDMNQAKRMILKDKELMDKFPPKRPSAGKSLPAAEPQPSSRT